MQPLQDVRVLDLSRLLPGPFCTQLLADRGADVIKVEDTERGDYLRWMPPLDGGLSAMFSAVNRGKRSLVLNLKTSGGLEAFLRMVERVDVVVEGFRPGVMDRLGVGYAVLRERNPRIILCSITGYGQDGPYRDRAGHDINYLAASGVLSITGVPPDLPVIPGVQIGDLGGGALMAAVEVLAALRQRDRTGQGCHLDVGMLDGLLSWMAPQFAFHAASAETARPGAMPLTGAYPCYRVYRCADGYLSVGALEPKFWRTLVEALRLPHLADLGLTHGSEAERVAGEVQAVLVTRSRAEWAASLGPLATCCEPVLDLDEVPEHPQVRARAGHALPRSTAPPPGYGEHTRELLAEAGYGDAELAKLVEEGATIAAA